MGELRAASAIADGKDAAVRGPQARIGLNALWRRLDAGGLQVQAFDVCLAACCDKHVSAR